MLALATPLRSMYILCWYMEPLCNVPSHIRGIVSIKDSRRMYRMDRRLYTGIMSWPVLKSLHKIHVPWAYQYNTLQSGSKVQPSEAGVSSASAVPKKLLMYSGFQRVGIWTQDD